MTHEEIKEALSAYFDGQLGPEQTVEISAHLAACTQCRAALDGIKAVSEGMKKALPAKAPAGLAQRALARAQAKKERRSALPAVLAIAFAVLAIAFLAGVVTKKYMPTMFSSIQGMINGAASTLGSSSGNQ
jgi:anti-sigma factor RsiW